MMLPILISVSLAPGSYFFCALAAVAVIAATANAARTTSLCIRTGMVSPPLDILFWPGFIDGLCSTKSGKSRHDPQAGTYSASRNGRLLNDHNYGQLQGYFTHWPSEAD